MWSSGWQAKQIGDTPDVIAADGSEVRILCATARGSMAAFALMPDAVSRAVAHRTIEEIWFVTRGRGRMWRKGGGGEETTELRPGLSLTIPVGVHFQFRNDGDEPLEAVAVAMPPWPGEGEVYPVDGIWRATV